MVIYLLLDQDHWNPYGIQWISVFREKGYIVEMAIPADALRGYEGRPGALIAHQAQIYDVDSPGDSRVRVPNESAGQKPHSYTLLELGPKNNASERWRDYARRDLPVGGPLARSF